MIQTLIILYNSSCLIATGTVTIHRTVGEIGLESVVEKETTTLKEKEKGISVLMLSGGGKKKRKSPLI